MDRKLTAPDVMEKTLVMSDVNEDLLKEELSSSGTQVDSTTCPTELSELAKLSPEEDHGDKKTLINNDLHQTESEDTFTIGSRNSQLHFDTKDDVNRALPVYVPWCKKNDPPQHPPALLPIRNKPRANEKTQLYSSTSRSRIKTTSCTNQTHNDACLFCNPLECLFATLTGCHASTLCLCSYLCGCHPTTLEPLSNMGDCCNCLVVHCCCSSDCNGCSVCLPAARVYRPRHGILSDGLSLKVLDRIQKFIQHGMAISLANKGLRNKSTY